MMLYYVADAVEQCELISVLLHELGVMWLAFMPNDFTPEGYRNAYNAFMSEYLTDDPTWLDVEFVRMI